jgi:hypothetical protein
MIGSMLWSGRFAFPLSTRASVASDCIIVGTAPVQLTVLQYHDVDIANAAKTQRLRNCTARSPVADRLSGADGKYSLNVMPLPNPMRRLRQLEGIQVPALALEYG